MPPNPPAQTDWVILQSFAKREAAVAWLKSNRRFELLNGALPMLVGQDIHIIDHDAAGVLPAPACAVVSTRVKSGAEVAYRIWEHKMAAVHSTAKGCQGYRFEPPIPGVQDKWVVILRFDCEANLQAWMNSPERLNLLKEAEPFIEESHGRIMRTGFDQWFHVADGGHRPAAWKMSMLVLLMLYPVLFLFHIVVQKPLLSDRGVPFWLALFVTNACCVALLNRLVPWVGRYFDWWLVPRIPGLVRTDVIGTGIVIGLYGVCLLVFALYSKWPLVG
jgi:antibiotic biosynthesis monooxygenase (ABM) superfamily enzyme